MSAAIGVAPSRRSAARRAPVRLAQPFVVVGLLLGLAADPAQPVLPLAGLLALGLALGLALALAARAQRAAGMVAGLLLGLAGIAAAQISADGPRGLLATHVPPVAIWQAAALGLPPPPPWPEDRLRAALDAPHPRPLPYPASSDEYLFNALALDARGDRQGAATALLAALARRETPRPDALLLHAALNGWADARRILDTAPLPPDAGTLLAALRLPGAPARVAALDAILAGSSASGPDALLALAALAHARIAATLPEGPTVAEAARIAPAVEAFADEARFTAFADQFLDPHRARLLRQGVLALDWVRDVASRRLTVTTLVPPPGLPGQPILLRLGLPEPARAVQLRQGEAWVEVSREDGVPTLRLPRPFAPQRLVLRYLDRDGVAAAELVHDFDPASAIRAQAQQALRRQGPFALYQPGWTAPGQVNPLPIAGALRAGLRAIEWWTEIEPVPRRVPVEVPDAVLLAGDTPRILVEITPPEAARLLGLAAIYADGSRGEPVIQPIR
ncbi:hypothetical protein [Falsiroseomonas sp.]|uniref:hypothetical protein n=1 Tax=Falsiroseomonas sp. TaxID=2870721 RepID=UPI002736DF42|nr:hypothetical protein [Falsiroseomonas sp.]MDP3418880.1 hypothetical protein [Falsiroseomonas sp.]